MDNIELGDQAQDRVSGFIGIAIALHDYMTGCRRIALQAQWKEGMETLPKAETFDENVLTLLTKELVSPLPVVSRGICPGDQVKDRITGYTGTAVAIGTYMNGTRAISIQGTQLGKDGAPAPWVSFDEVQVVKLSEPVLPAIEKKTGGPRPTPKRPGE